MNADNPIPSSIVEAQVKRLLEIVTEYQQQQCTALLDHAQQQAKTIIRQAYRNARHRLHHDIQHIRQSMRLELAATRAKQHTVLMQHRHREDQMFLDRAWQILLGKLQDRWNHSQQRQAWIQSILLTAVKVLPDLTWQVSHPVDWTGTEQQAFINSVHTNTDQAPEISFYSDTSIHAGLRISADAARVDGTLEGLLTDRHLIEAEILALRRQTIKSGV